MNVIVDLIATEDQQASELLPDDADPQHWAETTLAQAARGGFLSMDGQQQFQLSVKLVDEAESARLNSDYRGKNHATNVLSFPGQLPEEVRHLLSAIPLGDLAICPAVVRREAIEQNKAVTAHWAHMLTHGVLHLLGLDHESDEQALIMESLEIDILNELGYPDPYHTPEQRSPVSQ